VRWPTLPLSSKPSPLSARRPIAFRNCLYRRARVSSARQLKSRFSENQTTGCADSAPANLSARTAHSLVVGGGGFFQPAPIQSDESNKRCADNDHQT
jgi:hypothetical protein